MLGELFSIFERYKDELIAYVARVIRKLGDQRSSDTLELLIKGQAEMLDNELTTLCIASMGKSEVETVARMIASILHKLGDQRGQKILESLCIDVLSSP